MFVRKNAVSEPSSGNKPSILTALLLLPSFRYAYLGGRRGGTPHEYIRLTRATPHMTRCVRLEMAETTRGVGKKGRAFLDGDGRRRIDSSDRTVRRLRSLSGGGINTRFNWFWFWFSYEFNCRLVE